MPRPVVHLPLNARGYGIPRREIDLEIPGLTRRTGLKIRDSVTDL